MYKYMYVHYTLKILKKSSVLSLTQILSMYIVLKMIKVQKLTLFSHLTKRSKSSCVLTTASLKYVINPINAVFHLLIICKTQVHRH